jgi:urease accessory protein
MLNVFKSLPVISEVFRDDTLPSAARGYRQDTITLGWEERLKGRGRRRSDGGLEFGTSLTRGITLRAGDCFIVDDPPTVVVVVERAEPVLVVEPHAPFEWGVFAYQIGNSHHPMTIQGNEIVCADLPGMSQILEQHAIPYRRDIRPFTPIALVGDHRHP